MVLVMVENDHLRVALAVHYGARVTSLLDKASGREWMTVGAESSSTSEDARYWGEEAVAWDECFPTVSVWDASATPWGRLLRDHGDLWGRPWTMDAVTATTVTTRYAAPEFHFTRTLRLEGRTLIADYAVENRTAVPLPYLWALHALLAVRPGDRIDLGAVDTVRPVFFSLDGTLVPQGEMSWTQPVPPLPFALAEVPPRTTNAMGKLYAGTPGGGLATIGQPGATLTISWGPPVEHLGIWITYGAWPERGGHYEVALEPTNAPSDHLGQTIADGYPPLAPAERRAWRVSMTTGT